MCRLDERDVADLRIGLAFRAESRKNGRSKLRSKRQCTTLLNAIIKNLEDELCDDLRQYNRRSFIELSLRNHEKAMIDRERWERTSRANLALHSDKKAALEIIADHAMDLSNVLFPSRVLVEYAICECLETGGLIAGRLDYSKMMAKANIIWILGGWSDAIHLDTLPSEVSITPLGDVQVVASFESKIVMPFLKKYGEGQISTAVKSYEENFDPPQITERGKMKIASEFLVAWQEEFGFSIDDVREFIDAIDDIGFERHSALFSLDRSQIQNVMRRKMRA